MDDSTGSITAQIDWLAALFPVRPARGRPVTVLFSDIAGFTACAAARGDGAAIRLVARHDQAVLPALRSHGGRLLKRLGDGLMAAFPSPGDALRAALAMQTAASRAPAIPLRIGVHAGVARIRDGDLVGHEVNVASRIADRAVAGEVLVSAAVLAGARRIAAVFRERRPLLMAGREAVRVFAVMGLSAEHVGRGSSRCTAKRTTPGW